MMSRLIKDAPEALEAAAAVSTVLMAGMSKRKRQDSSSSSSSSSDDEKPKTGVNKPSGWFHERRIISDAEYNAKHLPSQFDAEFRFVQCFIGSKVPPTESKTLFSWQYHALLLILVHLRLFTFISLFGSAPGKNNNKTLPSVDFSAVNFNERSLEIFINIWFD